MNTHHFIAGSHFSAKTRRQLSKKGIQIVGAEWVPGANGSYANGETAYRLLANGCCYLRSFLQVRAAAESSDTHGERAVIAALHAC